MCVGVCLWGRGSDRRRSETTGGQVEEMKHRKGGLGEGILFGIKMEEGMVGSPVKFYSLSEK